MVMKVKSTREIAESLFLNWQVKFLPFSNYQPSWPSSYCQEVAHGDLRILMALFLFPVSGVNLESADAQEIGITYEMMQVREKPFVKS